MVSTKGIQLTAQGQHRLRRGLPIPESGPLDPLQVPLRVAASGIGGNDVHPSNADPYPNQPRGHR